MHQKQCHVCAMANNDSGGGNTKRFNGESLDPREYRRWKLWAEARMASSKDMSATHRGPFVLCLLDGLALEAVEHLSLDRLKEENGDKHIWAALEERFPDRLSHDWLAECLKEGSSFPPPMVKAWRLGHRGCKRHSPSADGRCRSISHGSPWLDLFTLLRTFS